MSSIYTQFTTSGRCSFTLRDGAGDLLLTSILFPSLELGDAAVEDLRAHASVESRYRTFRTSGGLFYFSFVGENGRTIANGVRLATEELSQQARAHVMQCAATATLAKGPLV